MPDLSCLNLSPWLDLEGRCSRNLRKALLFSLVVHVLVGVFLLSERQTGKPVSSELEVVLVNAQSRVAPEKSQALAQVALQGGGEYDQGRAKSPLPTLPEQRHLSQTFVTGQTPTHQQAAQLDVHQKLAELEVLQKRLKSEVHQSSVAQAGKQPTKQKLSEKPPAQATESKSKQQHDAHLQQDMSAAAQEIARLEAQVARQLEDYNKRPRQHFFSPSTSPYVFAMYEDHWRRKIEHYGNLNYPAEVKGKLYGALRLTVYIKKDGTVHQVELDQSSGSPVLDRAAMRIARMAAPYGEFSSEMQKLADILVLTRTWVFTSDALETLQR